MKTFLKLVIASSLLTACLDPNVVVINPQATPSPGQTGAPLTQVVTDPVDNRSVKAEVVEEWIVEYTNQAREAEKLPRLKADTRLAEVARAHSQNMATQDFFDHRDPEGRTHQNRLDARYPGLVRGSGENIARYPVVIGSDQDLARRLVEGWMNSPGHRANILRTSFTALGAGIAQSGKDVYATQVFAMQLTN